MDCPKSPRSKRLSISRLQSPSAVILEPPTQVLGCGEVCAAPHPGRGDTEEAGTKLGLGVAGKLSGTVSPFRAEQGTSLETPSRARASSCQAVGTPWFFSSCGGILELRRGSQPSPWVGPGKPNLPLGLRGKAGGLTSWMISAYPAN